MSTYDEKSFLEELKNKAERIKINKELYREISYSDFLYNSYLFIKELEKRNIKYSLHHIHSGSSVLSILLCFDRIRKICEEFDFDTYFINGLKEEEIPTLSICVSSSKKEEVISILNDIVDIDFKYSSSNAYYFGNNHKYHINILVSTYIDRLEKLEELTNLNSDDIPMMDIETIRYMLKEDDKDYYMPHLYGCSLGNTKHLYKMIDIIKPTSLFDLAKLECLLRAGYKDFSLVINLVKAKGLEFVLYSREQLKHLFIDIYDIPYKEALYITRDISYGRKLKEYQIDLLLSHEVPEYIINQFDNILYLPYLIFDYFKMRLIYMLSYYKRNYLELFSKVLDIPYKDSYVGPFFYIDKRLYSYKEKLDTFNPLYRYYDSSMSHFNYFASLSIDDDYGHFPRGRVIYNNIDRMFYIYIDKSMNEKIIKKMIIEEYHLDDKPYIFKYDSHYHHDEL